MHVLSNYFLLSFFIFHLERFFPMICSYTNESPRIKEAYFLCHLQSEEFQFQISSFISRQFILVCEAFHFLYSDCAKKTAGVI